MGVAEARAPPNGGELLAVTTTTHHDAAERAAGVVPTLRIRQLRDDEHDAVGRLTHDAYAQDYELSDEYATDLLRTADRLSDYDVWVAEDTTSGALIGTISTLIDGRDPSGSVGADELYFRLLAVSVHARRRGVGAALTEFAAELARQRGKARIVLNSGENMLGAHALYTALGFLRAPARERFIDDDGVPRRLFTFVRDIRR